MSDVGVLYYGGWLVLHGEVTAGHLVSFILYAQELGGALEASVLSVFRLFLSLDSMYFPQKSSDRMTVT